MKSDSKIVLSVASLLLILMLAIAANGSPIPDPTSATTASAAYSENQLEPEIYKRSKRNIFSRVWDYTVGDAGAYYYNRIWRGRSIEESQESGGPVSDALGWVEKKEDAVIRSVSNGVRRAWNRIFD